MVNVRFSELSKCGKYVATVNSDFILNIHKLSGEKYRDYNISKILLEIKGEDVRVNISQLSWEEVLPGNISAKIGVVVENLDLLLIFDLHVETPIIIQQSINDGIERFCWIPPIEDIDEGYNNCKQLVIYSKLYLKLKLYSLDATNLLFQIIRPINHQLILRPHHNIWSVVAYTMEYNQPPIIYHFQNSGSISQLIHNYRFPNQIDSNTKIEWSPNGRWISCFNDVDNLFGFNLQIFPMLAVDNSGIGKPIISWNWLQEGFSFDQGKMTTTSGKYWCNWLLNNLIITSINENRLQILFIDMKLLKISTHFHQKLNGIQTIWKQQINNSSGVISYKNSLKIPLTNNIIKVLTYSNYILVQLSNAIMIYEMNQQKNQTYKKIADLNSNTFELQTCINILLDIKSIEFYEKDNKIEVMVVTVDHVFLYRDGIIQVLVQEKIVQGYINQGQLVIFTNPELNSNHHWRLVNMVMETFKPKKRLLEGSINTSIDITDTFAKKKRIE